MKRVLYFIFAILIVSAALFLKYIVWRAEHPYAKTWTFFIRG